MSTKDNEINRDIDTAEGHIVKYSTVEEGAAVEEAEGHLIVRSAGEQAKNAGARKVYRQQDGLDDEAEGHRVNSRLGEAEGDALSRL